MGHQLLTDAAQQAEVALILLQHVGNQLVVVHVLHVIAGTPVEEAIKILSASPLDKYQRSDIRIQVRDKNGKQATVVFSVRYKGGQWKIYDVSFENVSILSSYRNSFDTEINQGGIDKLIAKIKTMKGNE